MTVPEMSETLEALLEYVRRTRGFDFTGYKHPSLMRRTRKRMQVVGIQDVGEYLDYMEVHPDEFTHLFNTILINVTAFFRDPQAWDFLAREAITRILGDRGASDPIRVWSAGCASGEEAYSLAMLLAEALGPEAFRQRVKIYATDVDTEALGQGRQGSYSEKDLEPVSAERRTQFFERVGDRYIFRPELRRSVIFGRHDLVQDAPISRQDLILCRNTLIYFNAETQGRVLARFHFALNDNGFLFLGRAETLLTHASLFMPLDLRHRVFSSVPRALSRERVAVLNPGGSHSPGEPLSRQLRLRHAALETAPVGRIMLDRQGSLVVANERARALLGLTTNDLGRSFRDIEAAFRLADLA